MLKVGVTGGIGSGKSAVSKRLAELGAYVFDADREAKKILDENETVQEQLIQEFGTDIQNPDGTISRKKLARKGFSNDENQAILNAIIHPFVFDTIDEVYEKLIKTKKYPIFVVDAALIYESGLDQHLDYVITVIAQYGLRLKRAMKRSNLTREEVVKRMDLQLSDNTKVQMADFIIDNNESEEKLYKQVDEVFHQLA